MARPYEPWPGCETMEWRSPRGDVIRFVTRVEAEGRMMPPVLLTVVPVPSAPGARFVGAFHQARAVALPVVFPGPIADRTELRRWAKALDPMPGEGTLTVVDGAWAGRQLTCAYETGLESLSETDPNLGLGVLVFRAAWPYWQDTTESSFDLTTASTAYHWFPFAGTWAAQPLRLGVSDVFATTTVTLSSDVDAWPVVTITGPATGVRVANDSTGEAWTLSGDVLAGSTLVVDHRPGHKTATLDGVNVWDRLDTMASLWPLIAGPNRVSVAATATTAATLVHFAWRGQWLAA